LASCYCQLIARGFLMHTVMSNTLI